MVAEIASAHDAELAMVRWIVENVFVRLLAALPAPLAVAVRLRAAVLNEQNASHLARS